VVSPSSECTLQYRITFIFEEGGERICAPSKKTNTNGPPGVRKSVSDPLARDHLC
jgi:hypothetical protein